MKIAIALTIITCLYLSSCDMPECKNTNPIFDAHLPNTIEYKRELVRQMRMRKTDDIRFWIRGYKKIDSTSYLNVYIQANDLCAEGLLQFPKNWTGNMYKGGYRGAELSGLHYEIEGDTNLIFNGVDHVID